MAKSVSPKNKARFYISIPDYKNKELAEEIENRLCLIGTAVFDIDTDNAVINVPRQQATIMSNRPLDDVNAKGLDIINRVMGIATADYGVALVGVPNELCDLDRMIMDICGIPYYRVPFDAIRRTIRSLYEEVGDDE